MPNDECQMTKEIQSPNIEGRSGVHWPGSSFGFGKWFMESPHAIDAVHCDHEPVRGATTRLEFRLQAVANRLKPNGRISTRTWPGARCVRNDRVKVCGQSKWTVVPNTDESRACLTGRALRCSSQA